MRTRSKLLMTALAAIAVMGMAVGSASANRLSLNNGERGFRIVWSPLTFSAVGHPPVLCNVTLEGSFTSRSIVKRLRSVIGKITTANVATCTRGGATVLTATLPWEVAYEGFTGTLPRITGINLALINAAFNIKPENELECLVTTKLGEPARGIANVGASGEINSLKAEEATTIRAEGFLCTLGNISGSFSGTGVASVLGSTAKTTVTLI